MDKLVRLEEIKGTIEKVYISSLFKQISRVDFDCNEMKQFFLSLQNESDRALSIVSFSYIDKTMEDLIRQEMDPNLIGGLDSLFNPFGPLATSSSRIKLAAAMHWISYSTHRGLELLRKIRNEFSHKPFLIGFENETVQNFLKSFKKPFVNIEKEIFEKCSLSTKEQKKIPMRLIFYIRTVLICHQMIRELISAPKAIRIGLPPFIALGSRTKRYKSEEPKLMDDLVHCASKLVLEILEENKIISPEE